MELTFGQAFDDSQSLPPIPLLKAEMDYVLLRADIIDIIKEVLVLSKGVCRTKTWLIDQFRICGGDLPKVAKLSTFMR
jgi:hypothetical protein